jgi:hypothetical protein
MRLSPLLLVIALAMAGVTAVRSSDISVNMPIDDEGLMSVKVQGLNHVYALPGVDLSRYTKIMLDPVEVSFRKTRDSEPTDTRLTVAGRRTIRDRLAELSRRELAKELVRSGHYSLVKTAGEDVLRIKAEIREICINVPDELRAQESPTYALSVSEVRLVTELRDASTGVLLARVVDFNKAPQLAWMKLMRPIDSLAAAQRAATNWARILRGQLDAAHDVAGKS